MSAFTRRELISALTALSVAPWFARAADRVATNNDPRFAHGVASGDPLHDRVILWTKVTPVRISDDVSGSWRIARDANMREVVREGTFRTSFDRDFTVKIDADRLEADRTYYYQFETNGARSVIGRTRTLPTQDVKSLRFASVSCSNYPQGYFNAYACIAQRNDLAFVVHLGDYLYEYSLGEYADPAFAGIRDVQPANEIISLLDYRMRHALYKSDPDLQEVHRQHPFICVWDDHEIANDTFRDGAENHNPERHEGPWKSRREHAIRAYNEYMPIRTERRLDDTQNRTFRIGALADLIMLDTRLHGRDKQAVMPAGRSELSASDSTITDPKRSLLGRDQEKWLESQLLGSRSRGTQWRLLGQQVMMAQLSLTSGKTIVNPDMWDGYAPARQRLFDLLEQRDVRNNIVLTGDIHSTWCNDLTANPWDGARYDPTSSKNVLAVEFACPAVSSPSPIADPSTAVKRAAQYRSAAPHLKYIDMVKRGYVLLDLNAERAQAEIYHTPTVARRSREEQLAAVFVSERGNNGLVSASVPSATGSAAEPAS